VWLRYGRVWWWLFPLLRVPEALQGAGTERQANGLHCGLEAAQGWQLVVSET